MVKTLAACAALCIVAVAIPRFHETVASPTAPARAFATDTARTGVRHAAAGETGVATSSNDGKAERQAAVAPGADQPPVVVLHEANAGWSSLFNH
ncbi:hypothetical protein VL15_18665 [Burkholderia cepacia]|uniref:Lipoprotein n=1 Tax=Burkholderia cepacia TaxID=292 RepID=A0A0J5WSK6_BURCE|nr:hypothetical protein [Burkholderia cepacia]KML55421.1 hypothetical protein VL15_18665 [Burkholderia cepacia]